MLDLHEALDVALKSPTLTMIVPVNQFRAGVGVAKLLTKAGVPKLCWPESHRELALAWQALALAQGSLSVPE